MIGPCRHPFPFHAFPFFNIIFRTCIGLMWPTQMVMICFYPFFFGARPPNNIRKNNGGRNRNLFYSKSGELKYYHTTSGKRPVDSICMAHQSCRVKSITCNISALRHMVRKIPMGDKITCVTKALRRNLNLIFPHTPSLLSPIWSGAEIRISDQPILRGDGI